MYTKTPTLIARPLHLNTLGGFFDTVKDIGKAGFSAFTSAEQAKGAAAALQAQQGAFLTANQGSGLPIMTIAMLGGVGVLAYLLLRKKKSA